MERGLGGEVMISTPRTERAELAEHAEKWGTFVLANILWAILSIPLITMPAATAAACGGLSGPDGSSAARGQQGNQHDAHQNEQYDTLRLHNLILHWIYSVMF